MRNSSLRKPARYISILSEHGRWNYKDSYDTGAFYYHRAGFLLRKLITAHNFEDENKRTAWVTACDYLSENDETPAERTSSAARVLRRVRRYDVDEIAEWLESGEIDESRLGPEHCALHRARIDDTTSPTTTNNNESRKTRAGRS